MKKVAIWYIWAGVGHYRTAKAVSDELTAAGYHVDIINPLETLANSDSVWGWMIVRLNTVANDLFKFFMSTVQLSNDIQRQPGALGKLLEGTALELYKGFQHFVGRRVAAELSLREYDAVLCAHPLPCGLAVGVRQAQKLQLPIINIFPDEATGLTCNFYKHPDTYMVVNSERVRNYYVDVLQFDPAKIFIVGYIGDPLLVRNREKIYRRVQDTLKEGLLNIGLYMGGFCPQSQQKDILSIIRQLAPWMKEGRATVRVITGPHYHFDRKVRQLIKELNVEKQIVVGRSDDMKEVVDFGHQWMLDDINVMFSRPSELSFYSLITGVPHILFPAVGGQEFDMRQMLQEFAEVEDYQKIRRRLTTYLNDADQLRKVSHHLFYSGYNVQGGSGLLKVLESVV